MAGVGYTLAGAIEIIHNLLLENLAGGTVALGIISIFIVLIWMRMSGANTGSLIAISLLALILYLSSESTTIGGYLPPWVSVVAILLVGAVVMLAFLQLAGKK